MRKPSFVVSPVLGREAFGLELCCSPCFRGFWSQREEAGSLVVLEVRGLLRTPTPFVQGRASVRPGVPFGLLPGNSLAP